jgi:aspartyl-tRNA(Asn)/glutamyl-tRNA(Gln) amidotransferase subunit B
MKTLIGLEIHTQLATKTKMFCGCANRSEGVEPNVNVCPVCLGLPGSLPVVNKKALELAIRAGFALQCEIADHSKFDRKNYFYPDLPKGYQISQYDEPICKGGQLEIQTSSGPKVVRLIRIHMEEDAAKATHASKSDYSLIDFNRAGTPLIESVTQPDMSSPEEARLFAQAFRSILKYLGVSNADMEKGQMRVDANINVIAEDGRKTPVVEIKNMNSFKSIERALEYEVARHQVALTEHAEGSMIRETRGWVDDRNETVSQRSKEKMSDYRYFPEPDIPPIEPDADWLKELRASIPELPQAKTQRLIDQYGLSLAQASQLASDKNYASFYEQVTSELEEWLAASGDTIDAKEQKRLMQEVANWILVELTKHLNKAAIGIEEIRFSAENFAEFIKMVHLKQINSSAAQIVLSTMFLNGTDPSEVVRTQNLGQVSDMSLLGQIVEKVIANNAKPVADVRAGKKKAMQFLIGMVMKESKGKANPEIVQELLLNKLAQ